MSQKEFNSGMFDFDMSKWNRTETEATLLSSYQKLALNQKGLRQIIMEIAKTLANDFTNQLFNDPEFKLIFPLKENYIPRAEGIIKTLFIKTADRLIKDGAPEAIRRIISDCLNSGLFKRYAKLNEKYQELKKKDSLESQTLIEFEKTKEENRQLKRKVKELEEELTISKVNQGLNSTNSNLPPSTDIYSPKKEKASSNETQKTSTKAQSAKADSKEKNKKKKSVANTRKKTGDSQGAQPGHQGKTLTKERINELLKSGIKKEIINIGNIEDNRYKSGWLLDLNIEPVIKEIRVPADQNLPAELSGGPTYGLTIRELVVLLSTEGLMGFDRLAGILNQLSGNMLNISTGTVYEYASEFSNLTLPAYFQIMESLKESPVLATDMTSFKVNGIKNNIRNHSTKELVWYFPQPTKQKKELFENPLLNSYEGILLHDHESSLYGLDCEHAECNIHLFRALINIKELTEHKWPDKLMNLFRQYDHMRKIYSQEGKMKFDDKDLENFETEFKEVIELARSENNKEKREKIKKKECTLINRIKKYKSAHTLFLYNFDVDFTNNISERDLRIVVRKRKMIGTFRTFRGLEIYCIILSIVESAKKQNIPVLGVIANIYQQSSELWAFFIPKFCSYYL